MSDGVRKISAAAALNAMGAECEWRRSRILILEQDLYEAHEREQALRAELEALRPQPAAAEGEAS